MPIPCCMSCIIACGDNSYQTILIFDLGTISGSGIIGICSYCTSFVHLITLVIITHKYIPVYSNFIHSVSYNSKLCRLVTGNHFLFVPQTMSGTKLQLCVTRYGHHEYRWRRGASHSISKKCIIYGAEL